MVNVICMKWGVGRYSSNDVNILQAMVKRQLTLPHRFVCLTDDAAGLNPEVESLPLPEILIPEGAKDRGWRKLNSFAPHLGDLEGTALFLDLDLVIVGNIDSFFEFPGEFCIIKDWLYPGKMVGNSSVYRWELGKFNFVLEDYLNNAAEVCANYRNEQAYLTQHVYEKVGVTFWPDEWCASFKRHCMPKWPLSFFKTPTKPEGAKIVVFHGHPKPEEAIRGVSGKPLRPLRPTPWLADHWRL